MRLRILTLLALCGMGVGISAQGIEFFHGSWEEALAMATAEDKLIFVDAYASWCGPCKKMSAQVFPQAEVGDYYNKGFINVKFDMEKPESAEFRKTHRVSAYPTLLFINGENEVVHKSVGGKSAPQLIATGKTALSKMDDIGMLASQYEAGNPSPKLAFKYVRALVRAGEPHLKVANEYLRDHAGELDTPEHLQLLGVAATEADSRIFDLLVEHRAAYAALEGEEAYRAVVDRAVRATFDKAIEFESESLLDVAVAKLEKTDKDAAAALELEGEYRLALAGTDAKAVAKTAKKYLREVAAEEYADAQGLFAALRGSRFLTSDKIVDLAAEAGRAAAELSKDAWRDYYQLADFLSDQDRKEEAVAAAEKSLASLDESKQNYRRAVEALIEKIRAR